MSQVLIGGSSGTIAANLSQFACPMGWMGSWAASDAIAYAVIPTAGTLSMLTFRPSGSPVTNSTCTLMLNGVATALTCGTATAAIAHDNVNSITVAAGDKVSVRVVTAVGATTRFYSFAMNWIPSINGENIELGNSNNSAAVANRLVGIANVSTPNATDAAVRQIIPETGTFKKLYVSVDTDPTVAATAVVFTVMNNGAASALVATVNAGSTTANDTTNSFAIAAAGNTCSLRTTSTGAPTLSPYHWGVVYVTTTSGNFLILGTTGINNLSTTTSYLPMGANRAVTTNETVIAQMVSNAFTTVSIWSLLGTAPGGVTSWTFLLRVNAANSTLSHTITGAAVSGNAASAVSVAADDLIDFQEAVSAGVPTVGTWKVAIIGNLADPASVTSISKLALLGVG